MKYVSAVDWLQFWCDFRYFDYHPAYEFKKLEIHTRQFEIIEDVYCQGVCIAQVTRKPFSKVINHDGGLVKIKNELLYHARVVKIISALLRNCHIKVESISRVDLCLDFQYFENGQRPPEFIADIMQEKKWKVGKAKWSVLGQDNYEATVHPYIISKGSRKGQQAYYVTNTFKVIGDANAEGRFTYMRWGAQSSEVNVYLYDKVKELREQHLKKYIVDSWRANGFEIDKYELADIKPHIWRLEFSIKNHDWGFVEYDTGLEYSRNNWRDLFNPFHRDGMLEALAKKYFDIRENTGKSRKDLEKSVELFKWSERRQVYAIQKFQVAKDVTRADKSFLRMLNELTDTYNQSFRFQRDDFIAQAHQIGMEFADEKGLKRWCETHGIDWDWASYNKQRIVNEHIAKMGPNDNFDK